MESRPKIKLTRSPLDIKLELVGKIVFIMLWALSIYVLFKLPAIIPVHYDFAGKVDRYGSKWVLLLLPALATIIYFGLTQLNKYPHVFNYMTTITVENAERQYTIATRMMRYLKVAILVIIFLIVLFTYLTTIGVVNGLGVWFLPVVFGLLLVPVVISIRQSLKNKSN